MVLLSKSLTIIVNRISERLLLGLWLMTCTVLLAAFAGLVRNQLLRPDPIYWIDSLKDLYDWKEVKIQTFQGTYLDKFTEHNIHDPMASNFRDRLKLLYYFQAKENLNYVDFSGIVEGRTAFVGFLHLLTYIKYCLSHMEEDIDYHISTYQEVSEPICFWTNGVRLNQLMFDQINLV